MVIRYVAFDLFHPSNLVMIPSSAVAPPPVATSDRVSLGLVRLLWQSPDMRFRTSQLLILASVVAARRRIHDRLGVAHLLALRHLAALLVLEALAQNQRRARGPGGV